MPRAMKRYIGLLIVVAGVIVGMIYAYRKWDQKTAETQQALNEARILREYADRVAWIRVNPDEKAYKDEVGTFFRWYFKEVNEHLNKFGGNRKFDDYLAELDERAKKKKGEDDNYEVKKAAYDYARKFFDDFKDGKYEPMWSSTDHGIRWDIVRTEPLADKTRFVFVTWGVPGEDRQMDDERRTRKWVVSVSFKSTWKMWDEKGKLYGEMPAEGVDMKVDDPQRRIKWFPRQIIVGHFDVPKIPADVKNIEVTFEQKTRSLTGGDINASHLWKLDLPAEWKLPPGVKWEGAQDSVRPEEEINARAEAEKKGKKK